MTRSRFAVALFAGLLWATGICGTGAFAENPQVEVGAQDDWWANFSGDSFSAAPTTWECGYMLRYDVHSGAVPGASAEITLPTGLADIWAYQTQAMYLEWTGATNTMKFTSVGDATGEMRMGIDAVPTSAVETPLVSATRSISDPVLTGDVQTQTITLDVTVASSLSGYGMGVNLISWVPDNLAYSVVGSTASAGFSEGGQPGSYYPADPSTLEIGETYRFTAEVQVTRSGELSQSEMDGDLYHKPPSDVFYYTYTGVDPATGGTSILVPVASGVDATFASDVPTDFTGGSSVQKNLRFTPVVAGVGPAAVSELYLSREKRTSISETMLYVFSVDLEADNVAAATITAPGANVYDMEMYGDEIEFWRTSTDEADLTDFGPGTYHIVLTGTDGVVQTYDVELADATYPDPMPHFDQAMGFLAEEPRPTLSWEAPGAGVDAIGLQLWSVGEEEDEYEGFFGTGVTSYTPGEDLGLGGYMACVTFIEGEAGTLSGGGDYYTGWIACTDTYFNVTPEPATLALMGLGAGSLLLRGRRSRIRRGGKK